MKQMFTIMFVLALSYCCHGQAIGVIYLNKEMITVPSGTPDHIEYEAGKSSLNDAGEAYLQYFIDKYAHVITSKDIVIMKIEPVPNATDDNDIRNKTGLKRVDGIAKYIYKKSDIHLGSAVMDGKSIVFGMRGRKK